MGMFGYVLMIFVGGPVVRFMMGPALHLVSWGLNPFRHVEPFPRLPVQWSEPVLTFRRGAHLLVAPRKR